MSSLNDPVAVLVKFAVEQMKNGMPVEMKVKLLRACGHVVLSEAESKKFLKTADALELAKIHEDKLWLSEKATPAAHEGRNHTKGNIKR